MELLTIKHKDFDLFVECPNFDRAWDKATQNVGADNLTSKYTWTDGVESVSLTSEDGKTLENGETAPAIFFDNVEYPIWVEFNNNVTSAHFSTYLQSDADTFSFRHHTLAGYLNYGNEIGNSELNLTYRIGSEVRHFTFGFEVLSQKLDYHQHWRAIIDDIEREYRLLSLDYLKRTFHGFSPDVNAETPELIWWNIFKGEQEKFVKACRNIIDRPHRRLTGETVFLRADKLKRIPACIENELAEHRKEIAHLYRVDIPTQSNDTTENRFLKYALNQIAIKYEALKSGIEQIKGISNDLKNEMLLVQKQLKSLRTNPFFRTVGPFQGLNQENQVLQKGTGYSQVYRTWNLLRRGYSLKDACYRLQTKDIATLYEIWCFIEVSHIVRAQLGIEDDGDVEHRNRMELNGLFTWELGKGEHSRILFKKDGVELAELFYNPKHTDKENDNISIDGLVVPTVPQKPDIVLQLVKNDLNKNMKMTYLFDAKYRIAGKVKGVDVPPDDAINQMHRYRDAIYYKEKQENTDVAELKKEVIGGYILFPGDGQPLDVQASKFQKTISEVNIGAFPLRPKDAENRKLLEQFIKQLIDTDAAQMVETVIPQKGSSVEVHNRVLIGLVKSSNSGNYHKFENSCADLYFTGSQFPTTIPLHNLHFFMPYFKGMGVRDVYEITKIRTITAKEAKKEDSSAKEDDIRLAFELKFSRQMFDDFVMVEPDINYTFKDTTFGELSIFAKEHPRKL